MTVTQNVPFPAVPADAHDLLRKIVRDNLYFQYR